MGDQKRSKDGEPFSLGRTSIIENEELDAWKDSPDIEIKQGEYTGEEISILDKSNNLASSRMKNIRRDSRIDSGMS
jgi:hypothetical protein